MILITGKGFWQNCWNPLPVFYLKKEQYSYVGIVLSIRDVYILVNLKLSNLRCDRF